MKFSKSYWWGLGTGIFISFIVTYLSWPQIPLDTEFRDGVKVMLPDERDKMQITIPLDGAKISGRFLVYGVGVSGFSEGVITLTNQVDQVIDERRVDFVRRDPGDNGTFITVFDLTGMDIGAETGLPAGEAGWVKLLVGDQRREVAKNHVRFK